MIGVPQFKHAKGGAEAGAFLVELKGPAFVPLECPAHFVKLAEFSDGKTVASFSASQDQWVGFLDIAVNTHTLEVHMAEPCHRPGIAFFRTPSVIVDGFCIILVNGEATFMHIA